jgi:homopolymeric O-antigen transport system permease protein
MSYAPESMVGAWTIEPRQASLFVKIGEVWRYRHLLSYFATRTLQGLYKRSSFGWLLMLVRVTAPIGLQGLIFGGALGMMSADGTPYTLFMLCGQTTWILFDRSLLFITRSMERNRKLIAKVYFPRLILPISAVSPALVFLIILALVLVGVDIYYWSHDGKWYIPLQWRLLLAPVAVLISLVFAIAVGFWTSVLQARYRDIRFGLRYTMSFALYGTTVLYPLSQVKPFVRSVVEMNPMECSIEVFRYATIGTPLEISGTVIAGQLLAILVIALSGIWFFNREESASVDKL